MPKSSGCRLQSPSTVPTWSDSASMKKENRSASVCSQPNSAGTHGVEGKSVGIMESPVSVSSLPRQRHNMSAPVLGASANGNSPKRNATIPLCHWTSKLVQSDLTDDRRIQCRKNQCFFVPLPVSKYGFCSRGNFEGNRFLSLRFGIHFSGGMTVVFSRTDIGVWPRRFVPV
jgi:hypothetical protein